MLDTLEKCLSGQPKDTTRYDEAMNVKLLLREVCQFIGKAIDVTPVMEHITTSVELLTILNQNQTIWFC